MISIRSITHIFAYSLPFILLLLVVINVLLANEVAPMGDKLQRLERDIEKTRKENDFLTQQVASSSSLLAIEEGAEFLGFTRPSASAYLTLGSSTFPVALSLPR